MIERKYQALPIARLSDHELTLAGKGLLFKISIITGWKMYDDAVEQRILEQQFLLKLKESYSNVNTVEIEYAFRNSFVKDWGKSMNLALIDEVMQPYLSQRAEASRLEEQVMAKPKELPASNETVTDEDWIEIARGTWEKTKNPMLLPPKLYRILNLNPTEEQKSSVRRRATLMVSKLIQDDPKFFKDDADAGVFQNRLLRQLCVADYFEGKI